MNRWSRKLALLLALTLVTGACGSDEAEEAAPATTAAAAAAAATTAAPAAAATTAPPATAPPAAPVEVSTVGEHLGDGS
ncbi:MAG TPA: hypothetical protein QGI67_00740, partial [Acidimicrobiales bacterium]|nr:hypothetical protein [Acidimicrobiales bacterium]